MPEPSKGKAYSQFGYPLHLDEHRGPSVDFQDVAQIPKALRDKIDRGGEDWLSRDEEKLMDAAIAVAKRELFARHLAALRGQTGGNRYDADGKLIAGQDEAEDE